MTSAELPVTDHNIGEILYCDIETYKEGYNVIMHRLVSVCITIVVLWAQT
jgi:hypothetical protein